MLFLGSAVFLLSKWLLHRGFIHSADGYQHTNTVLGSSGEARGPSLITCGVL